MIASGWNSISLEKKMNNPGGITMAEGKGDNLPSKIQEYK